MPQTKEKRTKLRNGDFIGFVSGKLVGAGFGLFKLACCPCAFNSQSRSCGQHLRGAPQREHSFIFACEIRSEKPSINEGPILGSARNKSHTYINSECSATQPWVLGKQQVNPKTIQEYKERRNDCG
eukprot:832122-Amphidinium_carterae.1